MDARQSVREFAMRAGFWFIAAVGYVRKHTL